MKLSNVLKEVISNTERTLGDRIDLVPDPDVIGDDYLRFPIYRGGPLRLNYRQGENEGCQIARQCEFIRRQIMTPPEYRFKMKGSLEGLTQVVSEVLDLEAWNTHPEHVRRRIMGGVFEGALLQLHLTAIGMRIDEQLYASYPSLRNELRDFLQRYLVTAMGALSTDARVLTPPTVFLASNAMNAALAASYSRLTGDCSLQSLFGGSPEVAQVGEQLFGIYLEESSEPANDSRMIDRWAEVLRISHWYDWQPVESFSPERESAFVGEVE